MESIRTPSGLSARDHRNLTSIESAAREVLFQCRTLREHTRNSADDRVRFLLISWAAERAAHEAAIAKRRYLRDWEAKGKEELRAIRL